MINSIDITNPLGETLTLELRKPHKSGFAVREIRGLGPVKANINITEVATADGGIYSSARASFRSIEFDLIFLPKPTIEDTRLNSYKYFPLKKEVQITINTDRRNAVTKGFVEFNEPDIFSEQEGTTISILCPDAYLYSSFDFHTVFTGLDKQFEFPFSNESLTEKLIIFAEIKTEQSEHIIYTGDIDIGFTMIIHALGTARNFMIYNDKTFAKMKIDTDMLEAMTGDPIVLGDDIFISTVKGAKSVTLLRGGIFMDIMNCLTLDSDWLTLTKGENVFTYTADEGVGELEFQILNRIGYEGV